MNSLRRHLSYANIVATLALVFAMSGGALAASHYLITKTSQIKPSVLKKLKARGPTGPTGQSGAQGAQGVGGPKGETGKEGAPGKNGATSVVVRDNESASIPNGSVGEVSVSCNAGERATGGGAYLWNGNDTGTDVLVSAPTPSVAGETPTGWKVEWVNQSGGAENFRAFVVCASP